MTFSADGGPGVHLPSQQFAEVVEALRAGAAGGRGHERRQATRIDVRTAIHVAHYRNGVPTDDTIVMTHDISIGGIGLIQARPAEPQEMILVRLPRLNRPPLVMLGKTMFCRCLADSIYNVGVVFLRQIDLQSADPASHRAELAQIQRQILA